MKKVIKLTERDLQKLIRRVIKEEESQRYMFFNNLEQILNEEVKIVTNFDRKYDYKKDGNNFFYKLKTSNNWIPAKGAGLESVKTKVFNISSSAPTQNKVQPVTNKAPITPQKGNEESVFSNFGNMITNTIGKVKEVCAPYAKRLKDFFTSFNISDFTSFPPHWRGFIEFLKGRTEPIKNDFFNSNELTTITQMVNSKFKNSKDCTKNKKCSTSLYTDTNFSKMKTGDEKVVSVGLPKSIGLTLGFAEITDNGNYYSVRDIYDFNNFKKNPEAYSLEKAPGTIKTALGKLVCGNFVQGLEELASFKHKSGYKGIPVELNIKKIS